MAGSSDAGVKQLWGGPSACCSVVGHGCFVYLLKSGRGAGPKACDSCGASVSFLCLGAALLEAQAGGHAHVVRLHKLSLSCLLPTCFLSPFSVAQVRDHLSYESLSPDAMCMLGCWEGYGVPSPPLSEPPASARGGRSGVISEPEGGWGAPGRAHVGEKGSASRGTPGPCRHPRRSRLCALKRLGTASACFSAHGAAVFKYHVKTPLGDTNLPNAGCAQGLCRASQK